MIQGVLSPRHGYDLTAKGLDSWYWSQFWRHNEAPVILPWLKALSPGRGLDAGAGTGFYVQKAALLRHRCMAIDLSLSMLALQGKTARGATGLAQADVAALPFRNSRFDWVLCTRVLSHVERLGAALQELGRVLRSGREALLSDVHPDHPYTCTSIRLSELTVRIETYKHSFAAVERAAVESGCLRILDLQEYRLADLPWKPPHESFEKIYDHPRKPIFYTCRLQKV